MASYRECDCVGCETCRNCGRNIKYTVYECDKCHEESTDPDFIFETIDGKDLCGKCFDELESEEDLLKNILDVTCGMRQIWFQKNEPHTVYCDRRNEVHVVETSNGGTKTIKICPDVVADFTNLPFEDNQFNLVVFDPPHLKKQNKESLMYKEYTDLNVDNWKQMIHDGFAECMRVLKPYGTLIFKWSDVSYSTREVLDAIDCQPLFGHRSGKKMNTHWMCFMKFEESEEE